MYVELTEVAEAEDKAKTVQSITFSLISDQMVVAFLDETFIVFGIERGYDGGSIFRRDLELDDFGKPEIVRSGIITLAEFEQRMEEISEKRRRAREAAERRRYKQLQAKFGGDT